ncbi:MAG: helix-turn-helix domain-containing protein [Bacteroidota bacterium]
MNEKTSNRRSDCPLSCWLEIFGDKWTLLIIRDIFAFNKINYKDFLGSNEGISTNILADRLKKLVEAGIVTREVDANNKLLINYNLSKKGRDMEPIFREIAKWAKIYIPDTKPIEQFEDA